MTELKKRAASGKLGGGEKARILCWQARAGRCRAGQVSTKFCLVAQIYSQLSPVLLALLIREARAHDGHA